MVDVKSFFQSSLGKLALSSVWSGVVVRKEEGEDSAKMVAYLDWVLKEG